MISLEKIINQALKDDASFAMLRGALTSSLAVSNPHYRTVVEFAGVFWDKYQKLPKKGDYEFWLTTLPENQAGAVGEMLPRIQSSVQEDWTPEYISREVTTALKEIAARAAVARLGTMVPNVPVEAIAILAEEIRRIEPVTISGIKDLAEVSKYVYGAFEEEAIVPSGIAGLDNYIGGFRSELIFTMADSGVGKSTLLVNFGAAAALRGARVLHVSLENSAENTLRRYYRRITETTGPELRTDPGMVVDKMNHWLKFAKGSVHVLRLPAYEIGADELAAVVDQYCRLYGGIDLLNLDYLDLMKPPAGFRSEYEGLGRLSHTVRNIGQDREAAVLSATQATRAAHQARHLRMDHMGDSYKKIQAADIIIGLVQTPEEFDANQGRLGLLKIRENPGRGVEIPVFVNMDLMMIADLDSVNTQRIAQRLRMSTAPVFREREE